MIIIINSYNWLTFAMKDPYHNDRYLSEFYIVYWLAIIELTTYNNIQIE